MGNRKEAGVGQSILHKTAFTPQQEPPQNYIISYMFLPSSWRIRKANYAAKSWESGNKTNLCICSQVAFDKKLQFRE